MRSTLLLQDRMMNDDARQHSRTLASNSKDNPNTNPLCAISFFPKLHIVMFGIMILTRKSISF